MSQKLLYDLIRKPIITEKSTALGEQNKYVFEVVDNANKATIKKAVEQLFSVKVKSVNTLNQKGKVKRFKGVIGKRKDIKKAIVTLENDNVIDFGGGVK